MNDRIILNEDSRSQLISKGKKGQNYKTSWAKGRNRFERRKHSRVANTVREYNQIDMNLLFKDGILTVGVPVMGETDNYIVKISFGNFLDILQDKVERNNQTFDLRTVAQTLTEGFNRDNVYIHCSCFDWKFRMAYFATRNQINSGEPETRPSDITNPNDRLGPGCKHTLLVLNNNGWLIKIASVIYNYVNWCKEHYEKGYANLIYPAIYNKPYEGEVQGTLFNDDELDTDEETISTSSEVGRTRGQFKPGNVQGIRFAPKEQEDELKLEFED